MPNIEKKIKKSSRKVEVSDETREKRRQNVIRLTEQGKMGGQFGKLGGRPRKPRAAERVAELARENADQIAEAFLHALDPSQPPYVQLQAAKEWLKIEHEESKLQLQEDRTFEDDSKDDLIAFLVNEFIELQQSGRLEDIINGEVVGEDEIRAIGDGQGEESA